MIKISLYISYPGMREIWKPLKYKNILPIYEISCYGNIRNIITGNPLSGHINKKGYVQLMLQVGKRRIRKFSLHILVAMTFISSLYSNERNTVNHKDTIKTNNHLYNLEWLSNVDNIEHARLNNLIHKGEECHNTNFTNDQVEDICYLLEKSCTYDQIIDELGLIDSRPLRVSLSRIKRRLSFVHISIKFKWELTPKQDKMMYDINKLINEGHGFHKICETLNIKLNSSNYDIYRNIRNYGVGEGSTTSQ